MADLGVTMQGLPEVLGKMQGLSVDLRQKGGRFAMRKAANLVRDAAQANAQAFDDPETPENIAANIVVRFSSSTFKRSGDVLFRVGVLGGATHVVASAGEFKGQGKANPGGDTFYWRFLEFGIQHMPAQPFMRPALADNTQAATNEFIRQYGKAIDRALRRAAKAQGVR